MCKKTTRYSLNGDCQPKGNPLMGRLVYPMDWRLEQTIFDSHFLFMAGLVFCVEMRVFMSAGSLNGKGSRAVARTLPCFGSILALLIR